MRRARFLATSPSRAVRTTVAFVPRSGWVSPSAVAISAAELGSLCAARWLRTSSTSVGLAVFAAATLALGVSAGDFLALVRFALAGDLRARACLPAAALAAGLQGEGATLPELAAGSAGAAVPASACCTFTSTAWSRRKAANCPSSALISSRRRSCPPRNRTRRGSLPGAGQVVPEAGVPELVHRARGPQQTPLVGVLEKRHQTQGSAFAQGELYGGEHGGNS